MSTLHVIDGTGDTKLIWDKDNEEEIAAAFKMFNELVLDKKFAAFAVKKKGGLGEQITKFDPKAEKIILTPPIVGG